MKNREEGDCPTYSLFYAKVQLCSKNNFSPCSKHFGIHFHINKNMINTAQFSQYPRLKRQHDDLPSYH